MNLRTITIDDYDNLIAFWEKNYFVRGIDSFDRFKLFLEKNTDLSILAEENDEIVGTILVSFDGRRGYLQKLVVRENLRGTGIGKQLVAEAVKRLTSLGVLYIPIAVEEKNIAFYTSCGFKVNDQVAMSKEVSQHEYIKDY